MSLFAELKRRNVIRVDNSDFMALLFSPAGKSLRAKGFPGLWDKYVAPDM